MNEKLAWSEAGRVLTTLRGVYPAVHSLRGQEALVVYFLSKYKFKLGVRPFHTAVFLFLGQCY